jgi:hypothetical protein
MKFYAHPTDTYTWPNGAIGHRSGSAFDCLGPYAKVRNCPIGGMDGLRLTCYATGYPDTYFSIPAYTRYQGMYIAGYFGTNDGSIVFHPVYRHYYRLGLDIPDVQY